MAKRYYWLKLKDDFFTDKRIKKLRRIAGGDTYTIIYLKMMMKCMNNDGILEYEGIESSFADELALDLDEDADNVQITVNFLMQAGLLEEMGENRFLMAEVPELIGSETAGAQRVRDFRNRQKMLQSNTDVTEVKQLCCVEKDIDIDKEKDKDIDIDRDKDTDTDKDKIKDKRKRKKEKIEKESKKENKKEKATEKANEKLYYPLDEKLNKAFADYVANRKAIKKPMSDIAIDRAIKKLDSLTRDPDEKIEILNQSIVGGWSGLYPLKKEHTSSGSAYIDAINGRMQVVDDWLKEYGQND